MEVYGQTTMEGNQGYRPYVDPDEVGEVDPNRYPDPKDSSNKIRGKSELLETLVGGLEPELITAKGFYFFFYAAFGSLFPLMGVFFKQLGLNGAQAGLLSGIRPLIEYVSAPFWVDYGERQRKSKLILLVSLSCWILFTFPLGSIAPEPTACLVKFNDSTMEIKKPDGSAVWTRRRRSDEFLEHIRHKRAIPKPLPGISPIRVTYAVNYDEKRDKDNVSPSFSSLVFNRDDVNKVFMLLLMLIIIGECLSSPSIVIADSAVLSYLGDEAGTRYGHQRMFGSIGWAFSMFFVGIALDHSTFHQRKCAALPQEKNYTVCFAIFVVLMGLATLLAWRIKMPEYPEPSIELSGGFENVDIKEPPTQQSHTISTAVFAQQNRKMPEWVIVLKHYKTPNCIAFLFVSWLMGVGIGLIFTFLFWHLQDFGGSPTLFGIASVINHISEVFAYFFATTFIGQLGHVKVLCIGLGCNVLRFIYITMLRNPWWVLPFEFVQGITHAAVWAACSSYLSHNTPPELRQSAQGVLQGLHHGLGRGFGAIVGGMFVASSGTMTTFRIYGFVCFVTLGVFGFLNFYRKDEGGFRSEIPDEMDPHQLAEETSHLAPHGVPGSIPRVHSNTRLEHGWNAEGFQEQQPMQQQPNPNNPFFAEQYNNR